MPAIQLARLKMQAVLLAGSFDRPAAFVSGLDALLNFYANRSFRPGQSGAPPPLLHAYNVPAPVLRQILLEISPLVQKSPAEALTLCDALWKQEHLEFRSLAIAILAQIPTAFCDDVIQRAQSWTLEEIEETLVHQVFEQGLLRTRRDAPARYQEQTEAWLADPKIQVQKLGLRSLETMLEDEDYHNFPIIFSLLAPHVRTAHPRLRSRIVRVVAAAARRSPGETAYFLRYNWNIPESIDTAWVIRQVIQDFPEDMRESLRAMGRK